MKSNEIISEAEVRQIKAYADLIDSVLSRTRTQGISGDLVESINRMKNHTLEIVGELEYVQNEIDAENGEGEDRADECSGLEDDDLIHELDLTIDDEKPRELSPAAKDTRDPRDVRSANRAILSLHDGMRASQRKFGNN